MLLAGWKFMLRASFSNYNVRNPVFIGILKFSSLYTWCTALTSHMQAGAQNTVATEHGLRFYRTRGAGSFKEATADFWVRRIVARVQDLARHSIFGV